MFWNKKAIDKKVIMDKVDEDLLKKEIFSADEAHQMGVQAKIQRRNDFRKQIFQNIKYAVQSGLTASFMSLDLFKDGNDVYFEGLGYKLEQTWHDRNGQPRTGEPTEDDYIEQHQWNGVNNVPYRYKPNVQLKISWEK